MDIEAKKIKSPYIPTSDYFSDLAMKIQKKVGIEPLDLGIKQENVTFKPTAKEPIQLTVEFGFPLTTQRTTVPDISMPEAPLPAISDLPPTISNLPTDIETPVEKKEIIESKSIDPVPVTLDPVPATLDPVPELEFSDEELDRLHAEMTGETFIPPVIPIKEKSNTIDVENQQNQKSQVQTQSTETKSIQHVEEKVSLWAMIPWSSILGVVASVFAVAAAWFVWNQIQKPLTVEQRVAKAVKSAPLIAKNNTETTKIEQLNIETLPASHQVIYDLIQEGNQIDPNVMNFNQMPEQSKISSVELERNGLTVLDLEDQIFDEIEL